MKKYYKIISIVLLLSSLCLYNISEAQTVIETLKNNNQTTQFAKALDESNLDERLKQDGPFTIFVPSNNAFSDISDWQRTSQNLLLNHIFMGMATERSLKVMSNVTFLSGKTISIDSGANGEVIVNTYHLQESNIKASNGVIHIINGVIK